MLFQSFSYQAFLSQESSGRVTLKLYSLTSFHQGAESPVSLFINYTFQSPSLVYMKVAFQSASPKRLTMMMSVALSPESPSPIAVTLPWSLAVRSGELDLWRARPAVSSNSLEPCIRHLLVSGVDINFHGWSSSQPVAT